MIYPDLESLTLEELVEKQTQLTELIPITNYSRRAQLQYFLKAYTWEINRRRALAKYASENKD